MTNVTACCSGCNTENCSCSTSSCTGNTNQTYLLSNIDVPTFHCNAWLPAGKEPCDIATAAAWRFKKPIIIDDDGTTCQPERSSLCTLRSWAVSISNCPTLTTKGRAHFNHLDEMKFMPIAAGDKSVCHRTSEGTGVNRELDCNALNQLADALPSSLCGNGLTCSCPPAEGQYCFGNSPECSGTGRCEPNDVEVCQ